MMKFDAASITKFAIRGKTLISKQDSKIFIVSFVMGAESISFKCFKIYDRALAIVDKSDHDFLKVFEPNTNVLLELINTKTHQVHAITEKFGSPICKLAVINPSLYIM